jgi:hypothetical protein
MTTAIENIILDKESEIDLSKVLVNEGIDNFEANYI